MRERRKRLARLTGAALFSIAIMASVSTGLVLGMAAGEEDPPPVALYSMAR